MRKTILFILLAALTVGCAQRAFTPAERALIMDSDSLMYVTTIDVPADSAILRAISVDLTAQELASPELEVLLAKMLYTVQHPTQDGVGIAAPQVGLNNTHREPGRGNSRGPGRLPVHSWETRAGSAAYQGADPLCGPGLQCGAYRRDRGLYRRHFPARDRPPGRYFVHGQSGLSVCVREVDIAHVRKKV